MTVEIQDRNEEARTFERTLEMSEMASVKAMATRIDWKQVARDDILGLDGTSVQIRYRGEDYPVWTPSDDTEKRQLKDFLNLKEKLFQLGGLTEAGLLQ